MLARILVSAVLFAAGFFLPLAGWSQLVFYLAVYAIIGWDIVWKAVRNIAHGQLRSVYSSGWHRQAFQSGLESDRYGKLHDKSDWLQRSGSDIYVYFRYYG